ncbi:MAG: hypothetical protein KDK54_22225 [Leptospiraceae bacterium]|nr:hypothetical protein [Leptospiraceae bacterium]
MREINKRDPLSAWFLGPKAEHAEIWLELIEYVFRDYTNWRRNYFPNDPVVVDRAMRREQGPWFDKLDNNIDSVLNQLKSHFPFFSPRYIAHMLSEQSLPAVIGYFAGMLYNPNNVTSEAAPVTVDLEIEVGKWVSKMLGYNPNTSWAHITSGGTLANTEALWVARTVQFNSLIVKDYCDQKNLELQIDTPNGRLVDLRKLEDKQILQLHPKVSLGLVERLLKSVGKTPEKREEVTEDYQKFLEKSRFNVNSRGLYRILKEVNLEPVILVSEAAHYSIKKSANLIGYGTDSVRTIPVDSRFRMNLSALEREMNDLKDDQYISTVIGIVGTTEEGAVDPIGEIGKLREKYSNEKNSSFWFHIDSAWGGYIRSLFNGKEYDEISEKKGSTINELLKEYMPVMDMREKVRIPLKSVNFDLDINWENKEVLESFVSMKQADSITIDPHKLGYIPYPAGMVAYKNKNVTGFIVQKANYIFDPQADDRSQTEITSVGPYILEGSKPGAAALSCWLAHKTIPLELREHGKIIKTSLLNTRKLNLYLQHHKKHFQEIHEEIFGKQAKIHNEDRFEFLPVYKSPDTNVICFIVLKESWKDREGKIHDIHSINQLNKKVYEMCTINSNRKVKTPYAQEFFVSRTVIDANQYSDDSVESIYHNLNISMDSYRESNEGLFVLRSTVMNPWYYQATHHHSDPEFNFDYLFEFVKFLHETTNRVMGEFVT